MDSFLRQDLLVRPVPTMSPTLDVPLLDPHFGDAGQVFDTWAYHGYLAGSTKSIGLGTSSVELPLRHPLGTARATGELSIQKPRQYKEL